MKTSHEAPRIVIAPKTPAIGKWVRVLSDRRHAIQTVETRRGVVTVALNEVYTRGVSAGRRPTQILARKAKTCADTCDDLMFEACGGCLGS